MFSITYSTIDLTGDAAHFYKAISEVTDDLIANADENLGYEVEAYRTFIEDSKLEKCRSHNEYLLELVMLGVLWRSNESDVVKTNTFKALVLNKLYLLRKRCTFAKPFADWLRGMLISSWLFHPQSKKNLSLTNKSFMQFLIWLNASGEYSEEVKRFKGWLAYSKTLLDIDTQGLLGKTYQFSFYFEERCVEHLGAFTSNVKRFVEKAKVDYRYREDFALATRKEVEYHLNMFGAEVLNRELRADFLKKKQKVLLLPTCMRTNSNCMALDSGFEKKCIGCTSTCNVGKVSTRMKRYDVETYLIPHSSDFTRFLERWKDKEVALIGVACVLNLLMGGYEMINLSIASQCVYLDHCGCKKHWDNRGVATTISVDQLERVLGVNGNDYNPDLKKGSKVA